MSNQPDGPTNIYEMKNVDGSEMEFPLIESAEFKSMGPLTVHVEIVELLQHWSDDEKRVFDFVGKLKDILQ